MFGKSDIDEFRHRLGELRNIMPSINWRDNSFTYEKAYVSAVFSKIAYLEIPDFELKHHSAIKVIPCLTYMSLLSQNTRISIRDLLIQSEIQHENIFTVTSGTAVVVGIVLHDVVFISIRGTVPTYLSNWKTDFHATKTLTYVNGESVKFHTGFYIAISDCLEQIASNISGIKKGIPIYAVGHSLGGAMAGIFNALSNTRFSSHYLYGRELELNIDTTSCYTVGMPRYGNKAITELKTPHHIYNEYDIVPHSPPKLMLFSDVPNMHRVGKIDNIIKRELLRIGYLRFLRHHFIEHYINLLEKMVMHD